MAQATETPRRPRFWFVLVGIAILLIFLYFYQPFESYVAQNIRDIRGSNIIFWFASLVGVVAFAIAHWQSFRQSFFRSASDLEVEGLVFDTLQIAILVAVILCAGATLQTIEMLSEHLINRGGIFNPVFGGLALKVIVLVVLAVVFYLLHRAVRAFKVGWRSQRPPSHVSSPRSAP